MASTTPVLMVVDEDADALAALEHTVRRRQLRQRPRHGLQHIPAALETQLRRRLRHEDRRVPGCRVTRTPLTPHQTRSGIKR
jgi:hypothetical protein